MSVRTSRTAVAHLFRRNPADREAEMSNRGYVAVTAGSSIWLLTLLTITLADVSGRAQTQPSQKYPDDEDYGYAKGYLNDAQRNGRDTWYFWTGGNEKFWAKMAEL